MAEHTPGPWEIRELPPDNCGELEPIYRIEGEPTLFLTIAPCSDGYVPGQNKANAYLIAAAPDLLAELRRLEWSGLDEMDNPGWCPSCGGYDSATKNNLMPSDVCGHRPGCTLAAAIAKATTPT